MAKEQEITPSDYAGMNLASIWGTAMRGLNLPENTTLKQQFDIYAAALCLSTAGGLYEFYEDFSGKTHKDKLSWMRDRLIRVCDVTNYLWDRVSDLNKPLYEELTRSHPRPKKMWGKSDEGYVPDAYFAEVNALATSAGWGIPRMLIMLEDEELGERFEEISDISSDVDKIIKKSKSPDELMCRMGEYLYKDKDVNPTKIVKFMLKPQIIADQDTLEMCKSVVKKMPESCPELWKNSMAEFNQLKSIDENTPGWMIILSLCLAKKGD